MELLDTERSVVVVIDLQGKLIDMAYRSEMVVRSTIRLLKLADLFGVPVVLTEQYPRGLGGTHPEVRETFDNLKTHSAYLDKTSFGCCGDAEFDMLLSSACPGVAPANRQVIVAGIEAHVCVMQTVIELLRANNQVHLCWECISGRGEEYRRHALDRMAQAGAILTNHESVGFEWARDKNHPAFKDLSNLLKDGQITE
ncbi:MAG: isochorismatase family protein [bacterium]|nr:isochorismatase family protein [bacterium]